MQENEKHRVGFDLTMEQFVECPTCHEKLSATNKFCPTDSTPLFRGQHEPEIPNYKIIKLLGSGGMGDVYEAEHVVLKKRVAIKTLRAHVNDSKAFLRFQAEAQATSRLKHPNIVSVYDCGVSPTGEPYMVMDKVAGITLSQLLETKGALKIAQGLNIVLQICQGVCCAHENAVLHRDLKPANVILEAEGEQFSARVLDFGIAKILENEGSAINLTRTGELFGTPAYMSPEQANGEKVDKRSDVYSIGCILYEVLTGQPPFIGKTAMEVMIKHMNETPLPLSQAALRKFPAGLEAITVRALAKKPADRFASVQELINAIKNFQNGINETAVATGGAVKVAKKDPLLPLYIIGGCSCSVIVIGLILWCLSSEQKSAVVGQTLQVDHRKLPIKKSDPQLASNEAISSLELRALSHEDLDNDQFKIYLSQNHLNKNISVKDCTDITDAALKDLANCPNLYSLDLTDCVNITDDGLNALSQSRGLAVLKLRQCKKITEKGIAHLLRLPILFTLDLSSTNIDDGIFKTLKTARVHNLILSRTKITDNALNPLANNDKYEILDFKGTGITDTGLKKIARLERLEVLSLIKCAGITDTGIKSLIRTNLTDLRLDQTQITDRALDSICQIKKLANLL